MEHCLTHDMIGDHPSKHLQDHKFEEAHNANPSQLYECSQIGQHKCVGAKSASAVLTQ